MNSMRLIVETTARLEWLNPPATKGEEIAREQMNVIARKAADDLREAVSLLVAIGMRDKGMML